jgi:hypothetical protein
MLLEINENNTYVDHIPLWCPHFITKIDEYTTLGFTLFSNYIFKKPESKYWSILRVIGTPYSYQKSNDPPQYNPNYIIQYKKQIVTIIEVFVYRSSSHYQKKYENKKLMNSIQTSQILWTLFDKILPSDILSQIETFIL